MSDQQGEQQGGQGGQGGNQQGVQGGAPAAGTAGAPPAGQTGAPQGGGRAYGTATREPLGGPPAGQQGGGEGSGQSGPGVRRVAVGDLSEEGLASRIERTRKTATQQAEQRWSKTLGISDPVEVKKRLDRAAQLEKEAEERSRAEMSETERLRADLAAASAREAQLQADLEEERGQRLYERQDAEIARVAMTLINPRAVKLARLDFVEHLKALDPKRVERMTERDVRKYFEQWAKDNPEFAQKPAEGGQGSQNGAKGQQQGGRPAAAPAARRPITNGGSPRRAAPTPAGSRTDPTTLNGKTARPGQANSMTRAEVKAFAAKNGINYPG